MQSGRKEITRLDVSLPFKVVSLRGALAAHEAGSHRQDSPTASASALTLSTSEPESGSEGFQRLQLKSGKSWRSKHEPPEL